MAQQYGLFGPVGSSKSATRGIFGPVGQKQKSVYDQTTQAEADAIAQDELLQQQTAAAKQKPKSQSLFSKIKNVTVRIGKDVGEGTGKAARAVARPIIDVASGQGGKTVHDVAQLSSDVTGGGANEIANRARKQVRYLAGPTRTERGEAGGTQLITEQKKASQNKAYTSLLKNYKDINTATGIQANHMAATGAKISDIKAFLDKSAKAGSKQAKKDLGATLAVGSLLPIGSAVKAATAGKDLLGATTISGVSGFAGNEGSTLVKNPNASGKELAKSGAEGFAGGVLLPVAGKIFGLGASRVLEHLKKPTEKMADVMTPEQADKVAAIQYTKITPEDQSAGVEKVGVRTPVHPGIKQQSTTYKVGVRVPQAMSDAQYTKKFNSLSNAYDKEMNSLKDRGPLTRQSSADAIDKKYQGLIAELNDNYKRGVLPAKTTVTKMSSSTDKAGKTTGGAPTSGVNVRSEAYKVGENSRITPKEAGAKLEQAGYAPAETKTILADALPEKGLSMPGSPKKIGLNDASVQQSAKNFDEAQLQKSAKTVPVNAETSTPVTTSAESQATPVNGVPVKTESVAEGSNLKPLQSIENNPKTTTSKLATSVQEKAVQDKIISKTEAEAEGLSLHNVADMKQQAEYATSLIKENPQQAIDIALGKAEAPAHILPQMVYNAVEEYARGLGGDDGAKLLLDLSRSKQVSNLTVMAQNVRAAGERDPNSPINAINQVKVSREEAVAKRGKSVAKEAQKDTAAIKKATLKITKDDWTSFVDGLRC